tara:strand:+ start:1052 stop:1165 length:114 start_codon:yes stop_codon:yes gene_type:complete
MNLSKILFLIGFFTAIRCRSFDPIRGDPILLCADLTS